MPARHGHERRWMPVLAAIAAAAFAIGAAAPASATTAVDEGLLAPASGAYLGSILDWNGDSVADQSARLGTPSAVYENTVSLPLSASDAQYVAQFFDQLSSAGSLGALSIDPRVPLADIDAAAAATFVDDLADALPSTDTALYLRFAPNMNGSWPAWGQDPAAYRAAFTAVADEVHAALPHAVMVWSPSWAGSYPFAPGAAPQGERLAELDTSGNGIFDAEDDPYEPYYPGDDAVDWVGLSLYHDDSASRLVNTVPSDGELASRLAADGASDGFYERYSANTGKPLMLETAAFFSWAASGADEVDIKSAWWTQAFDLVADPAFANVDVVLWKETATTRSVPGETVIDWSVTNPRTRAAFANDLSASDVTAGPVTTPTDASAASAPANLTGWVAWVVAGLVVAAVAGLFFTAVRARRSDAASALAYSATPNRDLRIDMLRGMAIVFIVVNHLGLVSIFQTVSQEAIGVVSGAELFVLLSGVVLAMVHRSKVGSGGIGEVVIRTTRRAGKLYWTTLAVVLLVFAISLIPGVTGTFVTTFVDQGTGGAGAGGSGRMYDLYTNADQLLTYPVAPDIVVDLALLRLGPWQFNIMGLYVILLLISPLILWLLSRRWWMPLLGVSVGLYLISAATRVRLLPSQFEDSFPLLTWQLLFVLGMIGGYYRREIVAWFSSRTGTVVLGILIAAAVACAIFSWNNPYLSSTADARLALIPDNAYRDLYGALFQRTYLEVGRLVNVLLIVVALYALLSAYWKPIHRALGWFFIPLGQATLYVFIFHVFFALLVWNIPALTEGSLWLNSAVYVVILGLLWLMVKKRFLYAIVPR